MCAYDDELEDEFEVRVRSQRALMEKGKQERGESFWRYVGLIGTVGWSIVVPMVLCVFLGLWLDRKLDSGSKCTLGLLLFGLSMGCLSAWRSITREQ